MDVSQLTVEEVELPGWQPLDETALGAAGIEEVPLPDGVGYGGANVWTARGKDRALYAVLCVERQNQLFGTYAFRDGDGRREYLQLQEFTPGRVDVNIEGGVAIMSWLSPNGRAVRRAQLPAYVDPGVASVATPISIVPTAPAAGGSGTDQQARSDATRARRDNDRQERDIDALEARVAALEARVSDESLLHALWSLLTRPKQGGEDWLYGLLKANTGGVVGQVQRLAAETARAMKGRGEI